MRAAALGHAPIVDTLLAHKAHVQIKRDDGNTALPYPAIVQKLLTTGVNVNDRGRNGWSPLTVASLGGCVQTVRLVIEHGADLQSDGPTALDKAASNGNAEVIETLRSHRLKASSKALEEALASAYSHPKAMEKLIRVGAAAADL